MKAIRRIGATLLALVVLAGALFISAQVRGWDWMFYLFVFLVSFLLVSLILQLILFIRLNRADAAWYDFLYWFVMLMSFGLAGYYGFIVKFLNGIGMLTGQRDPVFGYHMLILLPFVIQIALVVCREVRLKRIRNLESK